MILEKRPLPMGPVEINPYGMPDAFASKLPFISIFLEDQLIRGELSTWLQNFC